MDSDGMFHLVSMTPNAKIAREINEADSIGPCRGRRKSEPGRRLQSWNVRTRADDPGDSGPPKLKRGKPAERVSAPLSSDPSETDASAVRNSVSQANPAGGGRKSPHGINCAGARCRRYLSAKPAQLRCQEQTTRYVSETRQPNWNVIDVVSAEVVFEDNQESYRNLQINGKATKKSPEDSGAWSTGEFGTILASLFAP